MMTVCFLLFYYHMTVKAFLIYSSNFNVCTDRTRICFNMSSKEKEKNVVLKMLLQRRAKAQEEIK